MITILRTLTVALVLGLGSLAQAAEIVPVPPPKARVTDLTATLTPTQLQSLEETLHSFETAKGAQLAVLIVPTTQPETIEQFGVRVAQSWKLGRKGVDDGAILIVAKDDRTLRIEVGYGLEGALNDATAKRIVSEIIVPRFHDGDFAGGIHDGVERMIRVIDGEPLPAPDVNSRQDNPGMGQYILAALLFAVFIGGMLRSFLGRLPAALVTGGVVGVLAWLAAGALFFTILSALLAFAVTLIVGALNRALKGWIVGGRNRGTSFGTGLGGVGRGAGSRGRGFRGGGGSFGGGGASGRW